MKQQLPALLHTLARQDQQLVCGFIGQQSQNLHNRGMKTQCGICRPTSFCYNPMSKVSIKYCRCPDITNNIAFKTNECILKVNVSLDSFLIYIVSKQNKPMKDGFTSSQKQNGKAT